MFKKIQEKIQNAIKALKSNNSVIIIDDINRENEGDIVFPGEKVTEEKITFVLNNSSGIICLAMDKKQAKKLNLKLMISKKHNTSKFETPFTYSIESKKGITTGISAADRAQTIKVASSYLAKPEHISCPGHVFPLIANKYGVLGRQGHTEASVDLMKLSNFNSSAVICELMNKNGTVMKGKEIEDFAKINKFPIISIQDLKIYRLSKEIIVELRAETIIPFRGYNKLKMSFFIDPITKKEIKVLSHNINSNPIVRIHSSCITGDLFGSLKCDCQSQLHHALDKISKFGGILIYLDQEGRGIGLANKLKAYELQRTNNLNTIEANTALNLPIDNRKYDSAVQILNYYKIKSCKLISNNPDKIKALILSNIKVENIPSSSIIHKDNKNYLKTKKYKMKHTINGV